MYQQNSDWEVKKMSCSFHSLQKAGSLEEHNHAR